MNIMYNQDWHIHTEASYDASLPFEELLKKAKENGITDFGITDHVNYPFMMCYLQKSRNLYENYQKEGFHFGVELTTVAKSQIDYAATQPFDMTTTLRAGLVPGYVKASTGKKDALDLAMTEEEIQAYKVEYTVAAAHWLFEDKTERNAVIREWHDQQMFCATDKRVDIVGHSWWLPYNPNIKMWYNAEGMVCGEPWFDDFWVIPMSIHDEFSAALLENKKCAELNLSFLTNKKFTEKFKMQYMEYIRMLFEKGVPITIGSDVHKEYESRQEICEKFFEHVGFKAGDFATPKFRKYNN